MKHSKLSWIAYYCSIIIRERLTEQARERMKELPVLSLPSVKKSMFNKNSTVLCYTLEREETLIE